MHSQAIEDYLKTIYEIQCVQDKVSTTALAQRLGVTPASVTGMIKRLAEMKLVAHEPYQGVRLTRAGQKIALEVVRHHRLIEKFLAEALGVPWDRVHEEAHKIEHVLSEDLAERMDAVLGHPTTDPHGSPIPRPDGTIDEAIRRRLVELVAGQSATVAQVSDHDSALLRYLGEMGLYPQARLKVLAVAPVDGLMTVRVGAAQHVVSRAVASEVFVSNIA
jgi:DtxR family transcriptional regulator, Mn-dependent transcriptional regulator